MNVLFTILLALGNAVGPPTSASPKAGGIGVAPPPAWIEDGTRSRWLAYGSYWWKTAYVDMLPPESQAGLPQVKVTRVQMLRVHLAFTPRSVGVYRVSAGRWTRVTAQAGRTVSFRAQPGIVDVEVTGRYGSASYLVRLTSSARA